MIILRVYSDPEYTKIKVEYTFANMSTLRSMLMNNPSILYYEYLKPGDTIGTYGWSA